MYALWDLDWFQDRQPTGKGADRHAIVLTLSVASPPARQEAGGNREAMQSDGKSRMKEAMK